MTSTSTACPGNRGRLILRLLFDTPHGAPRVPDAPDDAEAQSPLAPAILPQILDAPRRLGAQDSQN